MWLFFLMWCAIIASVPVHHNTMEAFALPSNIKQSFELPDIFWNTSNPIFRIDNTDHIIDVNQGNSGNYQDYDRVNIVCPNYDKTSVPNVKDTEQFVIYHVTKEEYDTCIIRSQRPRIIAQCNTPYRPMSYPINFRSFTPMPNALEYKPGKDYHFISTSSKDDLHLRIGGMCLSNNMKIVFKVGLRHQPPQVSDTNSGVNKNTDTYVNQLDQDGSSRGDDNKFLKEGSVHKNVNKDNITQRIGSKGKKHKERRKHGERKKKKRKGGRKRNHNKNQNNEHVYKRIQNNDIWDPNPCPPGGCSVNVIESQEKFDFTARKNFSRNNYFNDKGYRTGNEGNSYGEIPSSRNEELMNDNPRGIIQDERSDVARVQDLMRHEPSISASSSTSRKSFFMSNQLLAILTFILYRCLSKWVSH